MLQIDGLARHQLERAIKRGRMPFLRKLLLRGDHQLRDFYSGLPSSTPAVQGEILYGVRTAVPSFSFYDRKACVERRMFNAESVRTVAEELDTRSEEPLLTGGSSYSNIYTAGADCARFCAERLDLPSFFAGVSPLRVITLFALYLPRFIRIFLLGLCEVLLATIDFFKGVIFSRQDFFKELKFVPTRLGVCIWLRELVEFMIRLDIQEGVPIIHANLLGYDEQSHRRGPDSRFAHWTLRGIDRVIRNLTRAAARSEARDYDIVIYSDHGQEATVGYEELFGRSLEGAVRDVLAEVGNHIDPGSQPKDESKSADESSLRGRSRNLLRREQAADEKKVDGTNVIVTAMGPIGQIYAPTLAESPQNRRQVARRLATDSGVPIVLYNDAKGGVIAVTAAGAFDLPEESAAVIPADHPFAQEVVEDLIALCRHRHAGDLVICGWRSNEKPITFAIENGSHGGIGTRETRGFVLAPRGFLSRSPRARALRGVDLYRRARKFLGRDSSIRRRGKAAERVEQDGQLLRVMTYNVHSCVGMDGRLRPERIAHVIESAHPDVVALQEVDVRRGRSRREDQAAILAEHLGMKCQFFSLLEDEEDNEEYGLAILSRFPFEVIKQEPLTIAHPKKKREARGAIWAAIELPNGRRFHLINTHLGLGRKERLDQAEILLSTRWVGSVPVGEPLVICGDFNSRPRDQVYRMFAAKFRDAQRAASRPTNYRTFTSASPIVRIDHIFANDSVNIAGIECPRTARTILASDHLPLCADLKCVTSMRPEESIAPVHFEHITPEPYAIVG